MKTEQVLIRDKNGEVVGGVASKMVFGVKAVATAGTRVLLLAANQPTMWIYIKATASHTVYVGDVTVTSTNGYPLTNGEELLLWVDNSKTPIYLDAGTNTHSAKFIAGYC